MAKPEITWKLNMDQANMIMGILADQPFKSVAELIADLQQQAQSQLQPTPGNGQMPEARVQ